MGGPQFFIWKSEMNVLKGQTSDSWRGKIVGLLDLSRRSHKAKSDDYKRKVTKVMIDFKPDYQMRWILLSSLLEREMRNASIFSSRRKHAKFALETMAAISNGEYALAINREKA